MIFETIKIAIQSLFSNKLRTLLSMLGIIIGVGAVIAVVSIASGSQAQITSQISDLGSNLINISPGVSRGWGGSISRSSTDLFTLQLGEEIEKNSPHVKRVVPTGSAGGLFIKGNNNYRANVVGTEEDYQAINKYFPTQGIFFTDYDVENSTNVIVLGTDLISELFGRKKAQAVVWVGFFMNLYMLGLMTAANWFPNTYGVSGGLEFFDGVYEFLVANTLSSMFAYLVAQSVDVRLYHFWKRLTGGKYLWLRNNGSTMVSQLVDSTSILTILYLTGNLGDNITGIAALGILILNSYIFKFFFALFDTPILYAGVWFFKAYDEDPAGISLYNTA